MNRKLTSIIFGFSSLALISAPIFMSSCSKTKNVRTWDYEVINYFNKNKPFEIIGEPDENYSFTYKLTNPILLFQISLINTRIDLVEEIDNFDFWMRKNQGGLSWYDIGQGIDKISFSTSIGTQWTKSYTDENKPKYTNNIYLTECTVNFNQEYFSTTTQFSGSQKVWFDYADKNQFPEKIHTIDYYFHFSWKK